MKTLVIVRMDRQRFLRTLAMLLAIPGWAETVEGLRKQTAEMQEIEVAGEAYHEWMKAIGEHLAQTGEPPR